MAPKISVCIPCYNRAGVLPELLASVAAQDFEDYEIVICEDKSPERGQIRDVVSQFKQNTSRRVDYHENDMNLGYDGNLRNIIEKASGDYCFMMGNDDLMCPSALSTVASALERHKDIGVVLRSYATFDGTPDNINQTHRYFDKETFFPAGPDTITTFYRRSVVIPGMVMHRAESLKHSTAQFDGVLLYQLHLVANILVTMNGLFLPQIIVLYRNDGIPYFGNSEKEREHFVPEQRTPESSLHFMRGMLDIARNVEATRHVEIHERIARDISNYSLPILGVQADKPLRVFWQYALQLRRMGLGRTMMFYVYLFFLLLLGAKRTYALAGFVKNCSKHTPLIGDVYRGETR